MAQKKTAIITARMTPADKKEIQKRAKKAKMTVTEYLTTCGLGKEIVEITGLEEILSELKAHNCNISENTIRKCLSVLVEREFIRRVHTTRYNRSGQSFQGNNNYYILDLTELPSKATVTACAAFDSSETPYPSATIRTNRRRS